MPILYCFAGLPGTGKSTLARALTTALTCVYLRIDTIEQALREAGLRSGGPEGYLAAYDIAVDNLRLGNDVVADSVNPVVATRDAWRAVADLGHAACVEIEGQSRDYDRWDRPHVVVDTAGQRPEESVASLRRAVAAHGLGRSSGAR